MGGHTRVNYQSSGSDQYNNWDTLTYKIDPQGEPIWSRRQGNPRGFDARYIHDEAWGIRSTPTAVVWSLPVLEMNMIHTRQTMKMVHLTNGSSTLSNMQLMAFLSGKPGLEIPEKNLDGTGLGKILSSPQMEVR